MSARRRPADELLVDRFRRGDDRAFDELHRRHRPAVHRFAERVLWRSGADADAVTQDVFLRAHPALRRGRGAMAMRPWLLRIARNRCLDALRPGHETPLPPDDLDGLITGRAAEAAEELSRREALGEVVSRLRRLPEPQRRVLVGQAFEGRTHRQLAAELGLSVSAVKSVSARAQRRLAAHEP